MALYTSNYLKSLARTKSPTERVKLMNESQLVHHTFDIFLCHSYLDKEIVEGLYLELTKMGFKVYVDWIIDPQLNRNDVTKDAAELIRRRLRASKSLLLALSANAGLSKWVPWELGYVDGNTQQCALLPVSTDDLSRTSFHRTEYLKLYPYVEKPNDLSRFRDNLWAVEGAHTYVDFQEWIKGKKPAYSSTNFY